MELSEVKRRVYENSLQTCEYIYGYENANSTITVRCDKHNYEFETKWENVKRNNRQHHICPLCQKEDKEQQFQDSIIELECAYCHSKFKRKKSALNKSKSGLYFCCREHKDLAQRIESGEDFKKIRPIHYDQANSKNYREKAFREYEHKCAICNWDQDEDVLEVHHIDENRLNNSINNLIILCPICHKKLTTHKYKLEDKQIIKV